MYHNKIQQFQFQDALKGFSKRICDQGKSNSYVKSMSTHVAEFLQFLEQERIEQLKAITQKNIDAYFHYLEYRPNKRRAGGLSTSYINKHREAVLRFMEYTKGTKTGESGFYVPYLRHYTYEKDILSTAEVRLLYEATDNTLKGITDRAILSLLYGCGLRKGEAHNLEVNDIDFSRGLIRLDNTKTKNERDVVISPKVQTYLEEYLYNAREMMLPLNSNETHVLATELGRRMSIHTIPWRIKMMAERAGIKKNITAHGLRHSIATHLLEELSLEEVSHFLGHKHLDSTQIYTHIKEANG